MNLEIENYINKIPEDKKNAFEKLFSTVEKNIPNGFEPCISYGIVGFVVPLKLYPNGYHCDNKLPLPFLSIAANKGAVSLYHMGIYASPDLYNWFTYEYLKLHIGKPDMGKSCIKFKKMDKIPYDLIGKLSQKMTPRDWISLYESKFIKK